MNSQPASETSSKRKKSPATVTSSPHLDVGFELDPADALEMVVTGEEEHVLSFVSRCREESVKFKAVREDDETHFRLI